MEKYRKHAPGYDDSARRTEGLRRRTIQALDLRGGETVVDVGCGTGLSFAGLQNRIGPKGTLIGIEPCAEMIARARERVETYGWKNVVLLESSAERAVWDAPADAYLFNFAHDVLRSHISLKNLFKHAVIDARVVASGMKLMPWYLAPVNPIVRRKARPYLTTFDGFSRPWTVLENYALNLNVRIYVFGLFYLAHGTLSLGSG
ncbi:MAG: methyltransferase domain-containing protein [Elusimicrobia bacterium]|nr:methyltransferase domain-containing protein [Elusimicrobiota bacterium]